MGNKSVVRRCAFASWALFVAAAAAAACGSDGSQAVDEAGGRAGEGGDNAIETGGRGSGGKGSGGNASGGTKGTSTGGKASGGNASGGRDNEGGDAGRETAGGADNVAGEGGAGETGGASGNAGTGNEPTGGVGGTNGTGGTGGDLPPCATGMPTAGGECDDDGYACLFAGSPCGGTARCTEGEWVVTTQCPPAPECPEEPPEDGTPCSWLPTDLGPQNCAYGSCPEGMLGDGEVVANCMQRAWSVDTEACKEAFQCGPETCPEGENCGSGLCLATALCHKKRLPEPPPEGYGEWYWSCITNSCGDAEIECECAETLCGGTNESCTGVVGREITCETQ